MKIYILADMEGVSGIRSMEEIDRNSHEYEHSREMMMADINAAVDAAFAAGATEIVVNDTHAGGRQVRLPEMDRRAEYELPVPGNMMPSLDESFDGLILLGHHAKAGTLNGFLDHTMSSMAWFDCRINGQSVGEIGIEAAYAAHFAVPVIAVTGDEATAIEAKQLLGEVECAIVKWGLGRNRAKALSISNAHAEIRKHVMAAAQDLSRFKPWQPKLPATIELTFYRTDMADERMAQGDVERVDARTVKKTVETLANIRI